MPTGKFFACDVAAGHTNAMISRAISTAPTSPYSAAMDHLVRCDASREVLCAMTTPKENERSF